MILDTDFRVKLGSFDLELRLDVGAGEVVAVLGPNGAGKTTVLRTLAGLQCVDAGYVSIEGRRVDDAASRRALAPENRPVGVVFQEYLLFPHLTLLDNVAFGPRSRGMRRTAARARAGEWLERVDLGRLAQSKPKAISGGQAQRVALARALATEPRLLLLDEPFAALDVGTRRTVRRDLRRHLNDYPGATVLVTHDVVDAMALADRVVILEEGRVTQAGTVEEIAGHPRSDYVAELVGVNLLRGNARGTVVDLVGGRGQVITAEPSAGPVLMVIEPRAVTVHRERPDGSARNGWSGVVGSLDLLGDRVRVHLDGSLPLTAEVTPAAVAALGIVEGATVWFSVKATEVVVWPA